MSFQDCIKLKKQILSLKQDVEQFSLAFDKAKKSGQFKFVEIVREQIWEAINEIKLFFFNPEKIKQQLLKAVFFTKNSKTFSENFSVGSFDEWFDKNVILKPETREVIFRGQLLEIEGATKFELPDNMTILSDTYIHDTDMSRLPRRLRIVGNLTLSSTQIKELPKDIEIEGDLLILKDKHLLKQAKKLARKKRIWGKVEYIK